MPVSVSVSILIMVIVGGLLIFAQAVNLFNILKEWEEEEKENWYEGDWDD